MKTFVLQPVLDCETSTVVFSILSHVLMNSSLQYEYTVFSLDMVKRVLAVMPQSVGVEF